MFEDMLPDPEVSENTESVIPSAEDAVPVTELTEEAPVITEEPRAQEQPAEIDGQKPKKDSWQKQLFKDAKDVLYMLAIFMLVYILCFRTVVVVGDSMYDTLVNGDRLLLINNLLYWQPEQGDIVVASKDSFNEGECIIKRVIATAGQEVDIDFKTGTVYVDGQPLEELYLHSPTFSPEGVHFPVVVPEGCLFVMGDNRMESLDSRSPSIGFIDQREILGKAVFLMIPGVDEETDSRDFSRIGVVE